MADPIAHIAKELPDSSYATRYTQLPDGSYAPITDTGGAPCCCDDDMTIDCTEGNPDCLQIDFVGTQILPECSFVNDCNMYATASGINRRVWVPQVDLGQYEVIIPAFAHVSGGSCGSYAAVDAIVTIFANCQDDVFKITQVSFSLGLNRYGDGPFVVTPSSGVFSWAGSAEAGDTLEDQGTFGCNDNGVYAPFGGGLAVITPTDSCEQLPSIVQADHCGGELDPIFVDLETIPDGGAVSFRVGDDLFIPVNKFNPNEEPAVGEWSQDSCPSDTTQWPVARVCGGTDRITYDPAARPSDGVTIIYDDRKWQPINEFSSDDPPGGYWVTSDCPSGGCGGLLPNDPRCNLPQYRSCPQCAGTVIDDPIIGPTFEQRSDDSGPVDPGMIAEIERQQMARSGQYPGRCPSCGS